MLKQQYIECLGLDNSYTYEELNNAFKNKMSETRNSNIFYEDKMSKACEYNDAINYLRQYSKKTIEDNIKVFSNNKCNMFGMTYDEFVKMLDKNNKNYNIDETIINVGNRVNEKMKNKKYIFPLTMVSEDLWTFPIDRLISMYVLDEKNNGLFASYIITLSNICNAFTKLDGDFSLDSEYINYINSNENSFLVYLSQKIEIKYICLALNEEEYLLRHKFEYESTNFNGTFLEYLQSLFDIKSMIRELNISTDELNEYYEKYRKLGYNDSIYVFLRELFDLRDYCKCLPSVFLSFKKRYMLIPKGERMDSFKNWVQLNSAKGSLGLTSDQLLEQLYMSAKEEGFVGQIDDYIKKLFSDKTRKLSLR